jgi:hypothetical protein
MKKVLFFALILVILGAANVNAQVRIGGNGAPNGAAVLDLNATDLVTGTKGLALPRVDFSSNTAQLVSGVANLNGMLVYNTNTALGAGMYYWNGSLWVKVSDGSFVETDGIVGNEITDTIANGGLTRSGAGTAASPYKVGIKMGGVTGDMIAQMGAKDYGLMAWHGDRWRPIVGPFSIVWSVAEPVEPGGIITLYDDRIKLNAICVSWDTLLVEITAIFDGGLRLELPMGVNAGGPLRVNCFAY